MKAKREWALIFWSIFWAIVVFCLIRFPEWRSTARWDTSEPSQGDSNEFQRP